MNGYGQMIPQNEKALYDALAQFQEMQQRQMMQNELMASGDPYARLGAALGGAVANKMGGVTMKDAEAQLLEAQFIRNQEIERARAEKAQQDAIAQRKQELADKAADREHDLNKIRAQADLPTSTMKELAAANIMPGSPEYAKAVTQGKGTQITNNLPGGAPAPTPMQEKMGTKYAEMYQGWMNDSMGADNTLMLVGKLKEIQELQETGKGEEAIARIGQYFNTDAGANFQAYNAVSSQMVLQQAEKLKGAMSDGDIRLLESTMPNFGNDPRANKVVYDILERAANKSIDNFIAADNFYQENKTLEGFRPLYQSRMAAQQPAAPQQQSTDLSSYSDDELIKALKGS